MGELARLLERVDAEATTPDGRIRVHLSARAALRLEFRPRAYGSYPDTELAGHLGSLLTTVWTRYQREHFEVENAYLGHPEVDPEPADRSFDEEARQLTVTGSTPSGRVSATSRDLVSWTVHLAPGIQRELSREEFAAELAAAVSDTVRRARVERLRLLDRYYDLSNGLPPGRRDTAGGRR